MKTVFIINPGAGNGKKIKELISSVNELPKELCAEVYITSCPGDAERFVKKYCDEFPGLPIRFFACGGDGTLNEVVNGAAEYENASVGVIPMGTGNDFCRNFPEAGDFHDLKSQLSGTAEKCDLIKYTEVLDEEPRSRYCVNMFNIGFDCNVADKTTEIKKIPFVSGSLAYLLAIFAILIPKKGANLKIELDGETCYSGKLLLTSIANGYYCGGGIKSNPDATLHDGNMSVNIIYDLTRLNFISKLSHYIKGTMSKLPGIEKILFNKKAQTMVITPLDNKMKLCVDGEIATANSIQLEVLKDKINFIVPKA